MRLCIVFKMKIFDRNIRRWLILIHQAFLKLGRLKLSYSEVLPQAKKEMPVAKCQISKTTESTRNMNLYKRTECQFSSLKEWQFFHNVYNSKCVFMLSYPLSIKQEWSFFDQSWPIDFCGNNGNYDNSRYVFNIDVCQRWISVEHIADICIWKWSIVS